MTTPQIFFKPAARQAVKLKIGVDGPSGSGKTEGMLALLTGITNGGKIAVADTENESASYFADRYKFDTVAVPNADADVLIEVIRAAVANGYDALGIDSGSHAWLAILQAKDANTLANPTQNHWAAWGKSEYGPKWERFMATVLKAPIHIVMTMRSKQTYEQIENNGQKKIVKLGLQPQVREGSEYELGLVFSVNMAHMAEASKDRTHLFPPGKLVDLCDQKVHRSLVNWMNTETPATHEACVALQELAEKEGVSQVTKDAVTQLLTSGVPSASKVARWTEQLQQKVATPAAGLAAAVTPSPLKSAHAAAMKELDLAEQEVLVQGKAPPGEFPLAGVNPIPGEPRAEPETDLDKARKELHDAMDHPFMPKEAKSFFSTRIRGGKVGTLVAARANAALAKICLEIGDELTATDAKSVKEVRTLLLQASTYAAETLTGILEKLKAAHPVGATA